MVQARLSRILPTLSFFLISGFLGAAAASAQEQEGWSICNETSMIAELATGRQVNNDVVIEGWNRVRPGECRIVLQAPLRTGTPYFLYGRTSRAHRGGQQSWTGDYEFCVDGQGTFSVESPPDCAAMGLETRSFQAITIEDRTSWTTTLRETARWPQSNAQAAGIQRLLGDAGVESGSIDGYIGRRTRAAIRTFLSEQNLPSDATDEELIDYLEQIAIERSRNLGFTICNRTEERIWAAIGRRRGEGWESRGWWALASDTCERVIDQDLISASHFVYAEMDTEEGRKVLTGGVDRFCISHSQFAILGRETCEANFYEEAGFIETDVPEDGLLIYEFFDRDFEYVETEDEDQ
ncbi:DUF1036 domain-containing protein [Ponticaulis sp.]|uniref:DUF1036 domain-containing protein n=1 Tax=Ponticaulis sp. TaxID=2020902 RepID=UPI0025E17768|nr:DUF1036 domain-containing protein [Ponticaulis sp.]|tara:strand:- start:927 stop:1979 length:1053 start_codon:yes stop_codon:yes gene_type:complete